MISNVWTDIEGAVEEGHFIQHELRKDAYLVCNDERELFVITNDQYHLPTWCTHTVIEIFQRGGCNEDEGVFSEPA